MIRVALQYTPRLTETERVALAIPTRLRNLRVVMQQQIAPALNRMLMLHWSSKGAAFGHPWAPWAPSTLRARLRKGNAAQGLLRDTNHLFDTIFRERSTDDRLRTVGGELRLEVNTRVPYAIFHQVGTSFMPERQIFPNPLPDAFKREVRDILRNYLLAPS